MIGTYGQLEKCSSMGRWGEVDLPDVADSAVDDAVAAGGKPGSEQRACLASSVTS